MLTKSNYSLTKAISLFVLGFFGILISVAQERGAVIVDSRFESVNLTEYAEINNELKPRGSKYFYFDFENEVNTIDFNLKKIGRAHV